MHAVIHALSITGSMTWEITWALILGFALSAVIQAVVRRSTVVRLLGDDRPRTLAVAAGLGAASSSCSYAAVALARALFRKGAGLHRRDGVRDRLDQPGDRARRDPGAADGLAVHAGRVRRRPDHDRHHRGAVPAASCATGCCGRPASRPTAAWPARWRATPRWTCPSSGTARSRGGCSPVRASPPSATSSSWSGPRSSATW